MDGGHALSNQDVLARTDRDEFAYSRLQPEASDEHFGNQRAENSLERAVGPFFLQHVFNRRACFLLVATPMASSRVFTRPGPNSDLRNYLIRPNSDLRIYYRIRPVAAPHNNPGS